MNYREEDVCCPECHAKLTFYNHPSLRVDAPDSRIVFDCGGSVLDDEGALVLYDTSYLCPKCEEMRMRFSHIGDWD